VVLLCESFVERCLILILFVLYCIKCRFFAIDGELICFSVCFRFRFRFDLRKKYMPFFDSLSRFVFGTESKSKSVKCNMAKKSCFIDQRISHFPQIRCSFFPVFVFVFPFLVFFTFFISYF